MPLPADLLALFGHFLLLSLPAGGGAITVASDMHRVLVGEMGLFRDKPYRVADAVIVRDSQLVQLTYVYLKRLEGVAPDIAAKLTRNLSDIAASRVQGLARGLAGQAGAAEGRMGEAAAAIEASRAQLAAAGPPSGPEPAPLVPIQIKMALSRCPIFEGFDQDDFQRLIEKVSAGRYPIGHPIVLSGDRADSMFIVALGRLAVIADVAGELHEVASLTPGQCFGELPLAGGEETRAASIVADTQATVLRIGYDDLREATSWRPQTRETFEANLARLVLERT
jgi:CRP-like cAMP-binding protein